ncbi:hypothetical protein IF128_08915 [Empedobacter stercoris]|uniref:hypothetical protein n=1 Tax=Empedobacter stercoris TaxID=1628248 RepID=UPI0016625EC9|nr:hypothetical protein [Empedobacter stercoris]MCA4777669.1 hypothetical protein [Empedobacter stercoris]MCA4809862.1 hypothetical protein [Empedobacter stercoris]QNT15032.1 hypothetical protein HNV03_10350 [Empedobacter stercoris]
MKQIITTFLMVSSSIVGFAQETFQFKLKFHPESSYQMDMDMQMNMQMQMAGDEKLSNELSQVETKMDMSFQTLTVTKEMDKEGDLPFEIFYKKLDSKMNVNGQEIPMDQDAITKELLKIKINGIENEKGRQYSSDEMTGNLSNMKDLYDNMMNSMSMFMIFPKETFKIGDMHEVIIPFKMPLQQGVDIEMNIKGVYKLLKIADGKAYFDVEMTSVGNIKMPSQLNINFDEYKLNGSLTMNVFDQNINESTFSGPMSMTMEVNNMKIKMISQNNYRTKTSKL